MDDDGYNFGVPESTTVGTSLGTVDCDGAVGTGVLSITVFAGFTISAKPTQIRMSSHNFLHNCHPPSLHFICLSDSSHCPQQFCHIFFLSGLWINVGLSEQFHPYQACLHPPLFQKYLHYQMTPSPDVTKSSSFISPRSSISKSSASISRRV